MCLCVIKWVKLDKVFVLIKLLRLIFMFRLIFIIIFIFIRYLLSYSYLWAITSYICPTAIYICPTTIYICPTANPQSAQSALHQDRCFYTTDHVHIHQRDSENTMHVSITLLITTSDQNKCHRSRNKNMSINSWLLYSILEH